MVQLGNVGDVAASLAPPRPAPLEPPPDVVADLLASSPWLRGYLNLLNPALEKLEQLLVRQVSAEPPQRFIDVYDTPYESLFRLYLHDEYRQQYDTLNTDYAA